MKKYTYWLVGILIQLLIAISPLTGAFQGYPRWDGPLFMTIALGIGMSSIFVLEWHYNLAMQSSSRTED